MSDEINVPVVELSHIAKQFGSHQALADVSMRVEPGEVFGFLGPNGAGKTTTLRILLDIIAPDAGRRRVFGDSRPLDHASRIGYLPEERGLYKNMTAEAAIAYLAELKGVPGRIARQRARELLERWGLGEAVRRRIGKLSKGMAQKVQVLSTIAHDPDLLILDEPFSGLDPVNQQVLEDLIADEKRRGRTIIFSTHVMQHAERLCDRILLIARGRDIFTGTVDQARRLKGIRIELRITGNPAPLACLPGITAMQMDPDTPGRVRLETEPGFRADPFLRALVQTGIEIERLRMIEPSLHEVFVHLVGSDADEQSANGAGNDGKREAT